MLISFIFIIFQLIFAIFFLYMCIASIIGAPFVPTKNPSADAMIALANIKKGNRVYDLGSGNGKLLMRAKKVGAIVVGYEINPILVLYSNIRGIPTRWKNFWHADITEADIIFIYLLPWKMDTLAKKIKTACKKGTIVVSNSFIFPGWKILRSDSKNHVYVFAV